MQANSPVGRLVSRYTRSLLRRYRDAGKLATPIADRQVEDVFVGMTDQERQVYEDVERYISSVYNRSSVDRRTAVGFVMTIYRRRLASSFHALAETLENRLAPLARARSCFAQRTRTCQRARWMMRATNSLLMRRSNWSAKLSSMRSGTRSSNCSLASSVCRVTRSRAACSRLSGDLKKQGYGQILVFTQFTDTLDFLRGVWWARASK